MELAQVSSRDLSQDAINCIYLCASSNPSSPFSPHSSILPQPCPEAFRARAPPPSARRSSLRTRGTRTSCRTQNPWTPRRRIPTARTSKLLIGQDLGNPAYPQTFASIKNLSWAGTCVSPKHLHAQRSSLFKMSLIKKNSPGDSYTWIGFFINWSDNLFDQHLIIQHLHRIEHEFKTRHVRFTTLPWGRTFLHCGITTESKILFPPLGSNHKNKTQCSVEIRNMSLFFGEKVDKEGL